MYVLNSEDLLAIIPIFQLRGLRLREGKGLSEVIQLRSHTQALKSNPQARSPAAKAGSPFLFPFNHHLAQATVPHLLPDMGHVLQGREWVGWGAESTERV